jgi:hypothetical protein
VRQHLKLGRRGASGDSPAPTVREHSTAPAWATAEGCPERVRGAGPSPPQPRHITAPNYTGISGRARMQQDAPRLQSPLTLLCHQGGDFRPESGGGFGFPWEAIWWLSAPLPLPFCLFPFLASLAWRCGVCGTGYCPGLLTRRSVCVPVACAGLAVDRGVYGGC